MTWIVIGVLTIFIGVVLWNGFVTRLVLFEYQRAVVFTHGKLEKVLNPGRHWILGTSRTIRMVDVRDQATSVAGQEVLTSDNIAIKTTLALRYRIASPEAYVRVAQLPEQMLYTEAQLALREIVAGMEAETILEKREEMAKQLQTRIAAKAEALGFALETAGIKDIMFPGNLKQIFAQVVEAKKAAMAALEKARGETATLRHLANTAKMLENNPALVTLKTLQLAGDGNHTLVLGLPPLIIPITKGMGPVTPGTSLPETE